MAGRPPLALGPGASAGGSGNSPPPRSRAVGPPPSLRHGSERVLKIYERHLKTLSTNISVEMSRCYLSEIKKIIENKQITQKANIFRNVYHISMNPEEFV